MLTVVVVVVLVVVGSVVESSKEVIVTMQLMSKSSENVKANCTKYASSNPDCTNR